MSDSGLLSKIVLHHEISAFLFREARILDEERYTEWLEFFTEDVHYWVPGVENLARRDLERSTSVDHMAHFDDTMDDLRKIGRASCRERVSADVVAGARPQLRQ